jgi:hypothetical protein
MGTPFFFFPVFFKRKTCNVHAALINLEFNEHAIRIFCPHKYKNMEEI